MQRLVLISLLLFSLLSFSQEEFDTEMEEDNFDLEASFNEEDSEFTDDEPEIKSTREDGRYIYHPNQEKGLFKINKNGEYLYEYDRTELHGFLHIKFGYYNFENFPSDTPGIQFEDFYDSNSAFTFIIEYDWPIFKKRQSLSLNFSGGVSYNKGNGKFLNSSISTPVQERYTLWFLPMGIGLTYKLKFISNQIFLPYINGFLNYNLLLEYREKLEDFKYLGIFGVNFSGGLAINLGWFERLAVLQLDQEFGINNAYLTLEGRQVMSFEENNDITGFVFLGGLSFEY